MTSAGPRPTTLAQLRASGWKSRTVKQEIRDNFLRQLHTGEDLFPGIVGYENTVVPEINIALLAGHDLLFLGEKGQAKSRLMRSLVRFLDEAVPYLDAPGCPVSRLPTSVAPALARLRAAYPPIMPGYMPPQPIMPVPPINNSILPGNSHW